MAVLSLIDISEANKQVLKIQRVSDSGSSPSEIRGEGVALLKNYSQGLTGSGKPKYTGTIVNIDEAKFNVWNNSPAYEYFESLTSDTLPHVVWMNYSLSKYGLVIDSIEAVDGFEPESFIYHKYAKKEVVSAFMKALKDSNISKKASTVIHAVLHMDHYDTVSKRLLKEYAAYSHHDNCPYGLLSHITKCIRIYNSVKESYSFLIEENTNDLMVISLALHDIGKIYEMYDGVYQAHSFLTHRGLGLEHFLSFKRLVVDLFDEEFFYMICSVLLQHHGEYGENPRTVYAMLVHMIDDLEANLTSIDDMLQDKMTTIDAAGTKIKYNGSYLNILS